MRSSAERSAAIAAAALAILGCSVASPETEVKDALARLDRVEPAGPGASLELARVRFTDVSVSLDGGRALVVAMVEADGRAGTAGTAGTAGIPLSYVGREAFAMERCARARWCLADGGLPAVRGVVGALLAAPRPPGARVLGWQVRVERDAATAGEDYEAGGRRLRARWEVAKVAGEWRVAPDGAPP